MNFIFVRSKSLNPYENLALENFFLRNYLKENKISKMIYIWQSTPSVVMGRFQNPWLECDLREAHRSDLLVVRRQSGGGCVYHDQGNLNFSFISEKKKSNKKENLQWIIDFAFSLGVEIKMNERYDLLLDGKKISGSAFKEIKDYSLHHATLLVDLDTSIIEKVLHHRSVEIKSVSISSKRSQVSCLKNKILNYSSDLFFEKVISFFEQRCGKCRLLDPHDLVGQEMIDQLKNWSWIYGETPKFEFTDLATETTFCFDKGYLIRVVNSSEVYECSVLINKTSLQDYNPRFAEIIISRLKLVD